MVITADGSFSFVTAVDLNECFNQIKLAILRHTRELWRFELPFNVSTMINCAVTNDI